jgi:hypothetical protein
MSLDDVASQAKFTKEQALNFPLPQRPRRQRRGEARRPHGRQASLNRITVVVDDKGVVAVDQGVKVQSHGRTRRGDPEAEIASSGHYKTGGPFTPPGGGPGGAMARSLRLWSSRA